ncbi:VOC family protein [Synechococcus sp. GFB01]|uniref:VOC family protein n=1 Tax=Synechococcus sp. GFB01 TaxID=1662190 RepID=UPI000B11085F|nr:VOC family protein [Synechococcus sp. GFB01]
MASELDHLFILTDIGAAAAERLISFGLVEGTSNTHPGQGTANRRFFFRNAMLELLWVHDPAEATSPAIAPTGLWERWQGRRDGCCPFGIGLRPGGDSGDQAPFPSWAYQPPYLPDGMTIAVGANSDRVTELWLFQIPFGQRPDRYPAQRSQPLEHRFGLRQITRVELIGPWQTLCQPSCRLWSPFRRSGCGTDRPTRWSLAWMTRAAVGRPTSGLACRCC